MEEGYYAILVAQARAPKCQAAHSAWKPGTVAPIDGSVDVYAQLP